MKTTRPRARKAGLIIRELEDEVLIYDLQSDESHCLNGAAAHVWQRCTGETTVTEIAASMPSLDDPAVAEEAVFHALDQLAEARLLDEASLSAAVPSGITRAHLIKRAGVAAAIALPLVSSIVAPTAAAAASGPTGPTGPTGATGPTGPTGGPTAEVPNFWG